MITKYDCLDCRYCLSYDSGFRIACSCPLFESKAIYEFLPLGTRDAEECEGFIYGKPVSLSDLDLEKATEDIDNTEYEDLLVQYAVKKGLLPWLK
jgi:hypothetical protein